MSTEHQQPTDSDRAEIQVPLGVYNLFQHDFRVMWTFDVDNTHGFDITLVSRDRDDRMVGSVMVMPSGLTPVTFDEEGTAEAERLCGPLLLSLLVQACRELSQALRDRSPLETDFLFTPALTCPESLLPTER